MVTGKPGNGPPTTCSQNSRNSGSLTVASSTTGETNGTLLLAASKRKPGSVEGLTHAAATAHKPGSMSGTTTEPSPVSRLKLPCSPTGACVAMSAKVMTKVCGN